MRCRRESSGLRPVDPLRDMSAIADLIQASFSDDLDQSGYAMLREMRTMGRLGAFLWLLGAWGGGPNTALSGFVWVEEGRIVGNVTVTPSPHTPDRWIISNVAVAQEYRGRGIARGLMQAALEMIAESGGHIATLQVRDDNSVARHIYETLGFRVVGGTAYLHNDRILPAKGSQLSDDGWHHLTSADAESIYRLARVATPLAVQAEWPVRRRHYHFGLEQHLLDQLYKLLGKVPSLRLAVRDADTVCASVIVRPNLRNVPQVELIVHPDVRGRFEHGLIAHALSHIHRWGGHQAVAYHPTYHPEGVAALIAAGFRVKRTLLLMAREL
ncbi:MAG: GNAT family N-acetyltransferase [Anaerolineae bacterium]|nr:GNAT family N-acetyltransferase [Anaerolineae bacterium]MDW8069928.1 GNAT family N-acetyltransferase [Anaerolineae bacterium]